MNLVNAKYGNTPGLKADALDELSRLEAIHQMAEIEQALEALHTGSLSSDPRK